MLLLLPLTLWLIAIVLKICGAEFLYRAVSLPVGVKNLTNIFLYILLASLLINFIQIVILNMKKPVDNNERTLIYRTSFIHIGLMSFTFCYTFVIYVLYAIEWLGSIPVGRG
jgi:hypothetical protein